MLINHMFSKEVTAVFHKADKSLQLFCVAFKVL